MSEILSVPRKRQDYSVRVLAIDGGAGVGKGAVGNWVADMLGFSRMDSGVAYRAAGLVCNEEGITEPFYMAARVQKLSIVVHGEICVIDGIDRTSQIRSNIAGNLASKVGKIPEVRAALLDYQLAARTRVKNGPRLQGVVADGRDQAFIFQTRARYFLIASAEVRAQRRTEQLKKNGTPIPFQTVLSEVLARDHADTTRLANPLKAHPKALVIDTSKLSIEEVGNVILADYLRKYPRDLQHRHWFESAA